MSKKRVTISFELTDENDCEKKRDDLLQTLKIQGVSLKWFLNAVIDYYSANSDFLFKLQSHQIEKSKERLD